MAHDPSRTTSNDQASRLLSGTRTVEFAGRPVGLLPARRALIGLRGSEGGPYFDPTRAQVSCHLLFGIISISLSLETRCSMQCLQAVSWRIRLHVLKPVSPLNDITPECVPFCDCVPGSTLVQEAKAEVESFHQSVVVDF